MTDLEKQIADAMWAGDVARLEKLTGRCQCCCYEHFHEGCPARAWQGCRGSGALTHAEIEQWRAHYEKHHGLTAEQFYGG